MRFALLAFAACSTPTTGPDPRDTAETGDSAGSPAAATVRLHEVQTSGEDGDWVELFNGADQTVDLLGWTLSDGGGVTRLPARTLQPGELLVLTGAALAFGLDADGETLVLADAGGIEADVLVVPALREGESYGLDEPFDEAVLVADGSSARFLGDPTEDVSGVDDSRWAAVQVPVGFDHSVAGGEALERALGQSATQSSDWPGLPATFAVDGDPATFSHTDTADLDPWWAVTLDADYRIERVELVNRYDCCAERLYNVVVRVLAADGAEVWASDVQNPVAEGESPTSPGAVLTVEVPGGAIGRSVRVDKAAVGGVYSSEWLTFAEVAVYGGAVAPYNALVVTDVYGQMEGTAGLRVPFHLDAPAPTRAALTLRYDDGFAAWVDSVPAGDANADGLVEASETWSGTLDLRALAAGAHTLAVLGANADDLDFLLAPTLVAQWFTPGEPGYFATPTPGEPNGAAGGGPLDPPGFDPPRGFYDAAQTVTITGPPGATLWVTTDGTQPADGVGAATPPDESSGVAVVEVPITTTTTLRAVAVAEGYDDSPIATHTFLYLDDVVEQSATPPGFPATWNSQSEGVYAADYAMDPELTHDEALRAELLEGLRSLPTLSIVTGIDELFGDEGLYANSAARGDEWERRVSLEWIQPDGSTGFQVDAKLQVHGYGWRYHSSTLKHSFRVQFQEEYGASKLEWPMFPDAPVDRFDSIVLRAGGSKTWLDFRDPAQAQYLHDAFARDTARDMGKVDGHATYVHLYLDGLYWGLYMPVERPDAGFAEEYFGGDDDEYDAVNRRVTTNEAIDGDLEAYDTMIALADGDLSADADAAELAQYLDVADLIDWMLIHQYTTNRDGPCCFEGNNQRGVRKREVGAGYRFFVWDMEYSLWEATDSTNIDVDVAGHASHAYRRLWDNASFRAQYSARAHELLTGDGALTPDAAAARYEARADEIWSALLAESARWGDTYREVPYTRDVEWVEEYSRLQAEYFPYRTGYMIEQLRAVGLWQD